MPYSLRPEEIVALRSLAEDFTGRAAIERLQDNSAYLRVYRGLDSRGLCVLYETPLAGDLAISLSLTDAGREALRAHGRDDEAALPNLRFTGNR